MLTAGHRGRERGIVRIIWLHDSIGNGFESYMYTFQERKDKTLKFYLSSFFKW
jgi:hypothetical protein